MGKIVVSKIDLFFFQLQCLQKCSRSFSGHYIKSYAHIMLTRQSPGSPWIINERKMKDSHFIYISPSHHPFVHSPAHLSHNNARRASLLPHDQSAQPSPTRTPGTSRPLPSSARTGTHPRYPATQPPAII